MMPEIHEWCGHLHDPTAKPPHPCPCIRVPEDVAAAKHVVQQRHKESVARAANTEHWQRENQKRWGQVA